MNLKKHYEEQEGRVSVVTARNSPLKYLEVDMLLLEDGKSAAFDEPDKEFALIVLRGTCAVEGENFRIERAGGRESVFGAPAEAVYVGRDTPFRVTGKGEVKLCVAKAPARKAFPPRLVRSEEVRTKALGTGSYARTAAFNLDESVEANLLYIGEFWVGDGNWASYPPHKHDVDNMPTEGCLDEIYYFEFDKPQGFGVQLVYSADGEISEAYRVKNGDFVEIPKGYHPCSVAPGFQAYCLWIMAGKDRGIYCTTEGAGKKA